jgi:pimeloyl-ACP methyl ester carboxylesterase
MTMHTTINGDVETRYETIGPPTGQRVLLIPGIGASLYGWPDDFCQRLVDRGFCVARLDNRDSGLSTHMSAAGRPNQVKMLFRPAAAAAYRLEDLAGDAIAVLDDLGWSDAHVMGISLGGMIAQVIAVVQPDRVRTLTSIASTPAPRLGQPRPRTLLKVIRVANPKRVKTADDLAQYTVDLDRITGSPGYPGEEEELRAAGRRAWDNGGMDVASVQRQTAAIAASGDRREQLAQVRVPTLVLHGEADQLIRPVAGKATAEAIPEARLVTYPGMGHGLPRPLWDTMIDEFVDLTNSGSETTSRTEAAQ